MARIIGPGIMGGMFKSDTDIKSSKSTKSEKGKKKEGIDISHNLFTDALNEAEIILAKEELEEGFEELEMLGRELVRSPNLKKLEEYKMKVSLFLKEALKKIYKVENKEGLPRFGQAQKIYVNISRLDEELEKLTTKFLQEQTKPMNIISEVEGIQGLIYNIII